MREIVCLGNDLGFDKWYFVAGFVGRASGRVGPRPSL
jgi:hypothetical protein